MINNLHELIMDFIHQFTSFGPAVEDCFSNGMCYHFTVIMCARFGPITRKVYDPIFNHFAVEIDGKIYDITGDITSNSKYKWKYWDTYKYEDHRHTQHIIRDCFRKIPSGVKVCEFCEKAYKDDWDNISCPYDKNPRDRNAICDKEIENA